MKTWFGVKLLLVAQIEGLKEEHLLCEESIRLVRANSEEEAETKAAEIGREAEHSYKNERGEVVSWKFYEILEIQDLCSESISDGMEVFSLIYEK